jgi:methylated-DNA-[protein]-cysteine S-methyltransferase
MGVKVKAVSQLPRLTCMPPIIEENARVLILGTMPGEQSQQKQQYYANPGNHFWKIIYGIFDQSPGHDYADRVAFVIAKRIALWDVLENCTRRGSSDSNIKNVVINDVSGLITRYKEIRCIAFGSRKASELFFRYLRPLPDEIVKRQIKFLLLPSPSGRNARINPAGKIAAWKKITEYI